jgi:hypothetical protein
VSADYLRLVITSYSATTNPYAQFALEELGWDGHGASFPQAYSADTTWNGNVPANAIDGNSSTWWQTVNGVSDPTLEVDLGAPTTLSAVSTQWYNASFAPSGYEVQTSTDGVNWTTALTVTNNTEASRTEMFPGGQVSADYLRLVITSYSATTNPYAQFALEELGWDGHGASFPQAYSPDTTWNGNVPANAIDGNSSTWWQTVNGVSDPTLEVDLGAPTTLSAVSTQWYNSSFAPSGYEVQTSTDGVNWTTALTVTNNTEASRTEMFPGGQVSADYLQVVITSYSATTNPYAQFALEELGWA